MTSGLNSLLSSVTSSVYCNIDPHCSPLVVTITSVLVAMNVNCTSLLYTTSICYIFSLVL